MTHWFIHCGREHYPIHGSLRSSCTKFRITQAQTKPVPSFHGTPMPERYVILLSSTKNASWRKLTFGSAPFSGADGLSQLDAGSCLVPLRSWRGCDAFPTRDDNSAPTPLTQRDNPGESWPSWPACPVTEERSLHSIKSKIIIIRKKEIWAESHESERRAKFQGFNQDKLSKLTSYWNLTYHWGE